MKIDNPTAGGNDVETKLLDYNIDREDIGLGQTYGVLSYGLSGTYSIATAIPEVGTNKIPNPALMWPGMLA